MKAKGRRWIPILVSLGCLTLLIGLLYRKGSLSEQGVDWEAITPALIAQLVGVGLGVSWFFGTLKYSFLYRRWGVIVPFSELLWLGAATVSASLLLPAKSEHLLRVVHLRSRHRVEVSVGVKTSLFYLYSNIVALAMAIVMTLPNRAAGLAWNVGLTAALLAFYAASIRWSGFLPGRPLEGVRALSAADHVMNLAISFVIVSANVLCMELLARAFAIQITPLEVIHKTYLVVFLSYFPVSLAGIGVREASFVVLMNGAAPDSTLLACGVLITLFKELPLTVIGLPFAFAYGRSVMGRAMADERESAC